MKRDDPNTGRTAARKFADPEFKTLIKRIAAFVAESDDPRSAAAEAVAELIGEAIETEVAAIRFLDNRGRTGRGQPGNGVAPGSHA